MPKWPNLAWKFVKNTRWIFCFINIDMKQLFHIGTLKQAVEIQKQQAAEIATITHLKEISKARILRTCDEYAQFGINTNGLYFIDPDGQLFGDKPIQGILRIQWDSTRMKKPVK